MNPTSSISSNNLTNCRDLDLLSNQGDPIEKIICNDLEQLQSVLIPYARVWAKHIYPRRVKDGALLQEEWQYFGGCHYTSLIRLHHALCAKKSIDELCRAKIKDKDYERLLNVHSACTTFWDNIGAAIDNFGRAKIEAHKLLGEDTEKRKRNEICQECGREKTEEKYAGRMFSQSKDPVLYYAFERRNQFIHSIIVPQQIQDGVIVFNLRHYDDASTDWNREKILFKNIDSQIKDDWDKVLAALVGKWNSLDSFLQKTDHAPEANFNNEIATCGSLNTSPLSGSEGPPPSGSYNPHAQYSPENE